MFVVSLFLDRLIAKVGKFIAQEIISAELKCSTDVRFFDRALYSFDNPHELVLPSYYDAVQQLQVVSNVAPPPPYQPLSRELKEDNVEQS